jgi:hypothetical protein
VVAQNAKDTKGKKAEKDKALVSISKSLVLAPEEGHGGSWTRGLDALRNGAVPLLLSLRSLLALLVQKYKYGGSWTRGLDALRNGTLLLSLLSLLALLVLALYLLY